MDIPEVDIYIDDVGAFSATWEQHLNVLRTVLAKLKDAGLSINLLKCKWAVQETGWLGY